MTSIRLSIIKTATSRSLEALTYRGGSWFKKVTINYSAFYIEHPSQGAVLFDTGLGRQIAAQYSNDMPRWKRPFLAYRDVNPVVDQLESHALAAPSKIFMSHGHWDHVSGLVDFAGAEVWCTGHERHYRQGLSTEPFYLKGASMPSQVASSQIEWRTYEFSPPGCGEYPESYDIFRDGSCVLVPLPGHTPGAVGMFARTKSRRYFLCGDAVWNSAAIKTRAPKSLSGSWIADRDRRLAHRQVVRLHEVMAGDPSLVVIPSHDGELQDALGYLPVQI